MRSTFLIADDSPDKMAMLRMLVQRALPGWTILETDSTEEARELIDQHQTIAAAFIDYYMPSENGPAVIAYLKEKIPSAKIALVSSADNASNCEEAKAAGADACVCTTNGDVEEKITSLLRTWDFGPRTSGIS